MRVVRGLAPEEVLVDLRDQIIALETLTVVELIVLERRRFVTFRFQTCDLLRQSVG